MLSLYLAIASITTTYRTPHTKVVKIYRNKHTHSADVANTTFVSRLSAHVSVSITDTTYRAPVMQCRHFLSVFASQGFVFAHQLHKPRQTTSNTCRVREARRPRRARSRRQGVPDAQGASDRCIIRLTDRVLVRLVDAQQGLEQLLGTVSGILHNLPMPSARDPVCININTGATKVYRRMYFSNICWIVQHRPSEHLVRAAVRPYLTQHHNAFGPSLELYSASCNLVIYQNRCSTLFRGGRETAAIQTILQHALHEDFIMRISMHMFVANGNIGHSISMQSSHVIDQFRADRQWVAQHEPRAENNSCMQIKLHSFDTEWMAGILDPGTCTVKSLLIIICISGNVNMFLTPDKPVVFLLGVENHICPFYEFFLQYLVREL